MSAGKHQYQPSGHTGMDFETPEMAQSRRIQKLRDEVSAWKKAAWTSIALSGGSVAIAIGFLGKQSGWW